MNKRVIIGAIVTVIGFIGLAIPYVTTHDTTKLAQVGDVTLESTEDTQHPIPLAAAAGAVVLGLVLIGAGLFKPGNGAITKT